MREPGSIQFSIRILGRILISSLFSLATILSCNRSIHPDLIESNIRFIQEKHRLMFSRLEEEEYFEPKTFSPSGELVPAGANAWTGGYFTAALWLIYQQTGDGQWKNMAAEKTEFMLENKSRGFRSIGYITCMQNAFKATGDNIYQNALLKSAHELTQLYSPVTGMIQAWEERPQWNFPAIVDYLSNLETLFLAARVTGDQHFNWIAVQFADQALEYHVRDDFSTAQVAEYDSLTGAFLGRRSYQGLNDSSTWARGQAWAIDGFAMVYRETRDNRYLAAAMGVADYFIRNLPADHIPFWDFDDPRIPDTYKDASAAALACSGLLELFALTGREKYRDAAEKILQTLFSGKYKTRKDDDIPFILKHSVGNLPYGREVDAPLVYADYYLLEALIMYEQNCLQDQENS